MSQQSSPCMLISWRCVLGVFRFEWHQHTHTAGIFITWIYQSQVGRFVGMLTTVKAMIIDRLEGERWRKTKVFHNYMIHSLKLFWMAEWSFQASVRNTEAQVQQHKQTGVRRFEGVWGFCVKKCPLQPLIVGWILQIYVWWSKSNGIFTKPNKRLEFCLNPVIHFTLVLCAGIYVFTVKVRKSIKINCCLPAFCHHSAWYKVYLSYLKGWNKTRQQSSDWLETLSLPVRRGNTTP